MLNLINTAGALIALLVLSLICYLIIRTRYRRPRRFSKGSAAASMAGSQVASSSVWAFPSRKARSISAGS